MMTRLLKHLPLLAGTLVALGVAGPARAQFHIDWFTIDTGGGKSVNGDFSIEGTIGQHDAGKHASAPDTELCGGYWNEITTYPTMTFNASVELIGVSAAPFSRCITFEFFDANCPAPAAAVDVVMTFTNGVSNQSVQIPAGNYTCATARDRKHTLRVTSDEGYFGLLMGVYYADFTGSDALPGGNLNDDQYVDILDFGGFVGQFSVNYGTPDTDCSLLGLHADISGDGLVDISDYSIISSNFADARQPDCCGGARPGGAITDISVFDLAARGDWAIARTADLNHDGRLNEHDIAFFGQHGVPVCPADFNGMAGVGIDDVFVYLNAWFARYPAADTDNNRAVAIEDIFVFLNLWFAGC